jgi:hypothetical protein
MVDAGILAEDETLERRVDFEARRIELHSEPHADGRYAVVRVLADDDPADRPETNRTFRARDFIPR